MKNPVLQRVRLFVAIVGGFLCLLAASTAYGLSTPFSRFAVAAFGLGWFAQAYVLRGEIRSARG